MSPWTRNSSAASVVRGLHDAADETSDEVNEQSGQPGTGPDAAAAPLPPLYPGNWLDHARALLRDPAHLVLAAYERCGPVFRFSTGLHRLTFIAGPEAVQFISDGADKRYLSRRAVFAHVQAEFGRSDLLLAQMGEAHARLRKPVAIAYSRQVVSPFVPAMIDAVRRHIQRWADGARVSVVPQVKRIAFAQYCELLGADAARLRYSDAYFFTTYQMNVTARLLPAVVLRTPWYRAAHRRTYQVLREMVRALREDGGDVNPPTILKTLTTVRDTLGAPLSDNDVVGYGGFGIGGTCGNVTRVAAFMLYEILRDPELRLAVTHEAQAAFSQGLHDATDVRRMSILRSVYEETLRFHPVFIGMPFDVERDFTYCGRRIRKGDFLVISPVPMSFSSAFRDAHRFDAARCRDPRNEHHGGTYYPFGLGDRTCVATGLVELMAMTLVATLLHEYDLALEPATYRLRLSVRPLPAPDTRFGMRIAPLPAPAAVEAAARVSEEEALATFPGHDQPTVQQALSRATRQRFAAGAIIVREGDPADAFYLLEKGTVAVSTLVDGAVQSVADLGEGDWFGEVGLLLNAPRNATVTAGANGADTLVLDRDTFLEMVAASDLVAREIGQLLRKRVAVARLRQAMPLLTAPSAAAVLPDFQWRTYKAGQPIFHEGDEAGEFFILVDGEVDVLRRGASGVETTVARLGPGDYFGERGLLHGAPRNATVRARTGISTLVTDRAGFDRMLAVVGRGELARALLARVQRVAPASGQAGEEPPG
jgi:CRP-like cAMP-binding protein/cytochrome P450